MQTINLIFKYSLFQTNTDIFMLNVPILQSRLHPTKPQKREFYPSGLKLSYSLIGPVNIIYIHLDNIFAAPIFGFSKRDISANNIFSLKLTTL